MKVLVYHTGYGCDTGCCGHAVAWFPDDYVPEDKWDYDSPESQSSERFEFVHDYNNEGFEFAKKMVAKELGEEHVKDLDFKNSFIVSDCNM